MNYQQLLALFKETHQELQQRAARSVDTSLVIRNWLFGWYIVEFEQGGAERVELYGKSLINRLSNELKSFGLKGISPTSLKQCSTFYLAYQKIGQAHCLLHLLMPLLMPQKCVKSSRQHLQAASLSDGRITLLC